MGVAHVTSCSLTCQLYILITFCHVNSLVSVRYYAGSRSSCVIDVREKGFSFLSGLWVVFAPLNFPERFSLLAKQTKCQILLPFGKHWGSIRC